MIPVNGIEVQIARLIQRGELTHSAAVELIDSGKIDEVGSYPDRLIIPNSIKVQDRANRVKILIASGSMMGRGVPLDLQKFDAAVVRDNESEKQDIETCKRYSKSLISIENGRPKVKLSCIPSNYLEVVNGYTKVNEKFKFEFPETAEAIKALQSASQFRKRIKRRERLHTPLRPFWAVTGRAQYDPSPEFDGDLLTMSKRRYRGIIADSIVCVDFTAAEMGIAGVLSDDQNLIDDYLAEGDMYVEFIQRFGLSISRDQVKPIVLGLTKGTTEYGIATRAKVSISEAKRIMQAIRERYRTYFNWAFQEAGCDIQNRKVVDPVRLLTAPLGFTNEEYLQKFSYEDRIRKAMSWRVQTMSSVILYQSLVNAVRSGLPIVATLHDSCYVEGLHYGDELERIMKESSVKYLRGLVLKTKVEKNEY